MTRAKMDFFFEFASTYSYLSAMRMPSLAEAAGVAVRWRPFLLGPIFAAQGWDTSPFNIYPAKGRYMWRDMQRRAARHGLEVRRPDPFPQNGLLAARVAQLALTDPKGVSFCQSVYLAEFSAGQDISERDTIGTCLAAAGLPLSLLDEAQSSSNKQALRSTTEDAMNLGLFGAPCFVVGEELFWGDDRLHDALDWATRHD